MFFLFQRMNQLRDLTQTDLFNAPVVSDFLLDKDPLFAHLTLGDDELNLYRQLYDHLRPQAPLPDLVIYSAGATGNADRPYQEARGRDGSRPVRNLSAPAV